MSIYNFQSLSSQDFEELARDLLQAEWNVALEAFRTGRDAGIDLRYACTDTGSTIIQCKHYVASGFSKLLRTLRETELPKVQRLAPSRYVVVTSVRLTPGNKEEILLSLQPFILSPQDIIGSDDIDGLLSRHPAVERRNFKLWLTSTIVLDRVIHNAELCQTDFEVSRIRRKLPLFVQNDAYPRAMNLLEQSRVVIISGIPGIGKTTLAEMLLYTHLEQGYEPITIQAEVAEGKKLFKSGIKQLFYYDDFLGQTFLGDWNEYLGRNQDVAIVDFMELVIRSPHSRFILTTREHIFRSALQISERLAHSSISSHRCLLELSDYSFGQRARILYNHLYFSDLPQTYKDAILEDDFFLEIIKNRNFNPRLIEWLSTHARLRDVSHYTYRAHISALLKSPGTIWEHAFQNQISDAARHVLLSLYTLGERSEICDLEPVFASLHRHSSMKYNRRIAPSDFRTSLQELEGAFLSYNSGRASYLNPSVREFVASVILDNREVAEDLLDSATRFRQIVSLWRLSTAHPNSELGKAVTSDLVLVAPLSRLLHGPSLRWEKMRYGSMRGISIDLGKEGRIAFFFEVAAVLQSKKLAELALQCATDLITSWSQESIEFSEVLDLLERISKDEWILSQGGGRQAYRQILSSLLEELASARAEDWVDLLEFPTHALEWTEDDEALLSAALAYYCKHGVYDERADCTTLDDMNQLLDSLSILDHKFGLNLDACIDSLNQDIFEREEESRHYSEGSGIGGITREAISLLKETISDEDVRQMFSTLRDLA